MTINLTIKNDRISTYLNTKDSLIGLEKAVDNGQTRLALEVMVDIVNELVERLTFLENQNHILQNDNAQNNLKNENFNNKIDTEKSKQNIKKEDIEKK